MTDNPIPSQFERGAAGAARRTVDPEQPQSAPRYSGRVILKDGWKLSPTGYRSTRELEPGGVVQPRPRPELPNASYDDVIDQLPNAQYLKPSERWLYGKLPMVMDKEIFGKPIGELLESFNDSWAGKALNLLDVGAEALERGHGFLSQWSDALNGSDEDLDDFKNNLAEAWYAGSLFADMTNLPGLKYDEAGNLTGVEMPGFLGDKGQLAGRDGIVAARKRITELTGQGLDISDALKQVRAEYYTDLGALSIRAQMQDTYYHMLLDPLNVVMGQLKPVERVTALRNVAVTERLLPGTLDGLGKLASEFQDAAKVAEAAGDAAKAADALAAAERVLARADSLRAAPEMSRLEKFALFITGGDPLEPTRLAAKWNPFSLAPEARAQEMLTVVCNNFDNYIISKFNDPFSITEAIARAKAGSLGPEYGHAFLTIEGRTAQAVMSAAEVAAKKHLADYVAIAPQMETITRLSQMTGETIYDIVRYFEADDVSAFVSRIAGLGDEGAALAARLDDDFVNIVKLFNKNGLPYTTDLFKRNLSDSIREAAAKLAIAKFGVKERGFVQKLSGTVKTAETIAFLRMNPTFVAKNIINNENTMAARGLAGFVSGKEMTAFIEGLGFTPYRMREAFTMAGEQFLTGAESIGKGEKLIADTLRGNADFFSKVDDWIRKGGDKIPKWLDMGEYASKVEQSASARAFYVGYKQAWNRYFWRPGSGYSRLSDVIKPEVLSTLDLGTARAIEQLVGNVTSENELRALTQLDNLNLNAGAIADDIVQQYGYDVYRRFEADYIEAIKGRLGEAMPNGTEAVRRTVNELRQEAYKRLDDMAEAAHQSRIQEVAAITQMEGPTGILKVWGDAIDEFHGFTVAYDARMSRFVPEGGTAAVRNATWKRLKNEANMSWERQWQRVDEVIEGMKRGAANLKDVDGKAMKIPGEVSSGFTQWRKEWSSFYTLRNKLQDSFFDALVQGKTPKRAWVDIQAEISEAYAKAVAVEADLTTRIDDALTGMVQATRPDIAGAFSAWRGRARQIRGLDRQALIDFRESLKGVSPQRRAALWQDFWAKRQQPHIDLWRNERAGLAMLQGDPRATMAFSKMDELSGAGEAQRIRDLAHAYNIPTATKDGVPLDRRVVDTVNKYMRGEYGEQAIEGAQQFARLEDIPEDIAHQAFEARRIFNDPNSLPPEIPLPTSQQFDGLIVDSNQVLKEAKAMTEPLDVANDQHWLANGLQGLDDIEAAAIARIEKPPLKWGDLSPEQYAEVQKYLTHVEGQLADARLASIKFGEFRRDSALLNYNRRYNYNNWLSVVMPFEFWSTQSLAKWAIHSIDRPAMLTNYLRIKKMLATAGLPQNGFPSRLRNSIRIELPFLPDWMGGAAWVDPLRTVLPFDNWASMYENYVADGVSENGRVERLMQSQVQEGTITMEQMQSAMQNHDDPLWQQTLAQVRMNDSEGRSDAWDYATMLLSPHAPLIWAKEALIDKTPENIGAFLPISRTIKQAAGVLGIETSNAKWNVGANIRRAMGLPAFDKWEDYRVDRELSNMAAEGYDVTQIRLAMINREGPLYEEATSRAAKVFAGGGAIPFLMKTLGIPTQAYPEGEMMQRNLQDDFSRAYEAYDNGDVDALTQFFDAHPEYESRLALWDSPEERLQSFLVDNIWSQWNEMPYLQQRQFRDAMPEFQQLFLNKETRNYNAINPNTMQVWLKLMGGDPPGSLNSPTMPLELADSDTSWRVEQFYNLRGALYPNYSDLQDVYFNLDDDAKKKYRREHPELTKYWDWRNDFFHRNPDVVPYLDDDYEFKYKSEEEFRAANTGMPQYTFEEWSYVLGSRSTARVLAASGEIPMGSEEYLRSLAEQLGISLDDLRYLVQGASR